MAWDRRVELTPKNIQSKNSHKNFSLTPLSFTTTCSNYFYLYITICYYYSLVYPLACLRLLLLSHSFSVCSGDGTVLLLIRRGSDGYLDTIIIKLFKVHNHTKPYTRLNRLFLFEQVKLGWVIAMITVLEQKEKRLHH